MDIVNHKKDVISSKGELYWKELFDNEFNYKVIPNFLPCNYNLHKWGKKQDDKCYLCNEKEDIAHLLYKCKYAQTIWSNLNKKSHFYISMQDVILGDRLDPSEIFILCSISYFIFKNWLKHSYENVPRNPAKATELLKVELTYLLKIYSILNCSDLCRHLRMVIDLL